MTIRLGTLTPQALYKGTVPIYKAYLGTTLLFDVSYIVTQDSNRLGTQNNIELVTQASTTY